MTRGRGGKLGKDTVRYALLQASPRHSRESGNPGLGGTTLFSPMWGGLPTAPRERPKVSIRVGIRETFGRRGWDGSGDPPTSENFCDARDGSEAILSNYPLFGGKIYGRLLRLVSTIAGWL